MVESLKGSIFMSKNDDRIIDLKKQIEAKKEKLVEATTRFVPETNCVLELDGVNYNLNVCTYEVLTLLMIKLNTYIMSANDLGIPCPIISGYSVELWVSDIHDKLRTIEVKREQENLKKLETKLDKLLSDDKKTELELNEISALLST